MGEKKENEGGNVQCFFARLKLRLKSSHPTPRDDASQSWLKRGAVRNGEPRMVWGESHGGRLGGSGNIAEEYLILNNAMVNNNNNNHRQWLIIIIIITGNG
jgi:hypothetical protein